MTLHVHFAGSYGSGFRFGIPEAFNPDLTFYGYDRDEDVARAGWVSSDAKERFFGVLLSDAEKTVDFNKNIDIYTSSYLKTNQHWPDLYTPGFTADGDYMITEAGAVETVLPLKTTTLDLIAARHDAPVDALIMDTQGAELDILKGGSEQLCVKTLAVYTEIGMGPLYEGQPMFWDLAGWLHRSGFLPASIYPLDWSPYRGRIGWRGKVFHWAGDAMFLKDIDYVVAHHADPREDLRKLAFLAVSSGYIEYAVEALRRSSGFPAPAESSACVFDRFLDELALLEAAATEPYPLTSRDTRGVDFEARRESYVATGRSKGLSEPIRRLINNQPDALTLHLQRYGFDHVLAVLENATRRDVISTMAGLGFDANQISAETLAALDPQKE